MPPPPVPPLGAARRSAPRPLAISHRGHHVSCPENTLESFRAALALGADGIETDVRLTREGLPVLYHDRNAPDGREVAGLLAGELSEAAGYHVPTLEEALALSAAPLWNLEVKAPAAAAPTAAALAPFCSSHRLLVTSFWHPAVLPAAELGIDCGLLLAGRPLDLERVLPARTRITHLVWFYEALDPPLLAQAASRGLLNLVYGPATPGEHQRCRALAELAGVITDYLHLLT